MSVRKAPLKESSGMGGKGREEKPFPPAGGGVAFSHQGFRLARGLDLVAQKGKSGLRRRGSALFFSS